MNQDNVNNFNSELPSKVLEGIRLFNQKMFYAAHEFFEDAWRETSGPYREFYRALLHISGGFFRLTQGKPNAARKFFKHALKWLVHFEPVSLGLDVILLKLRLEKIIQEIENHTQPDQIIYRYSEMIFPLFDEEI